MTHQELEIILTPDVRCAIEQNLSRRPTDIALDKRIACAAEVATQVKYLARASTKLPSYYAARCVIPPLAFEQASSEECAARKGIAGDSVLDLTCGLGVDALYLSHNFSRVVTLERDEVLAAVAAENFRRLGATNISVVQSSAEEFLASCTEHFDYIYADPDRRGSQGEKLVRLEDCSPDVIALMPQIAAHATALCLKNSPLFDVDRARQLFSPCRVTVVSLGGECKEVLVTTGVERDTLRIEAIGLESLEYLFDEIDNTPSTKPFDADAYRWLITPDVALQKGRAACHYMRSVADIWSNNGYAFAVERPERVCGRVYEIERISPYNPRELKRRMKGLRAEILKRDFPLSVAEIVSRTGLREGGERRIAFTRIGESFWVIEIK